MSPKAAPRGVKRRTGGLSALLEHVVDQLQLVGFHIYRSNAMFKKVTVDQERYVVRNYPHSSLYGTRGSKEAYLVADDPTGAFVVSGDGKAHIIMEAKWQQVSGSVDEKLPYVYDSFLESPYPNWVVVLDGAHWKSGRGKAAVAHLASKPVPQDRRLYVLDRPGFINFAHKTWGNPK